MKRKLNRRTFLRAAGVAVALPALDAMVPDPTSAAAMGNFGIDPAAPAKRMIMICTSLGLHGKSLFPEATGRPLASRSNRCRWPLVATDVAHIGAAPGPRWVSQFHFR